MGQTPPVKSRKCQDALRGKQFMSPLNRRDFLGSAVVSAASLTAAAGSRSAGLPLPSEEAKKKPRRAMYFNDARHFYLYCYEPPMQLEDAWRPIDEVAGTSVNTFIYGVESGGLFSNTKVGLRWGGRPKAVHFRRSMARMVQHAKPDRPWAGSLTSADRSSSPAGAGVHHEHAYQWKGQEP